MHTSVDGIDTLNLGEFTDVVHTRLQAVGGADLLVLEHRLFVVDGNKQAGSHGGHVGEELHVASVEEVVDTDGHDVVVVARCLGVEEEPADEADDHGDCSIAQWDERKNEVIDGLEGGDQEEGKEVEEPDKEEHELG